MADNLTKIDFKLFDQKILAQSLTQSVDKATTPYLLLSNSSDALNQNFIECAINELDAGADLVFGGYEIVDENDEVVEEHSVPAFLSQTKGEIRCFEDMFIPDCKTIAVRTGFAWKLGFDENLESMVFEDFILRAIEAGGTFKFIDEAAVQKLEDHDIAANDEGEHLKILSKFSYEKLRELYVDAEIDLKSIHWALAIIATKRNDFDQALDFLQSFLETTENSENLSHALDPYPQSDEWKYLFMRGTIFLLKKNTEEGLPFLQKALEQHYYFEAMNNCGVAHRMLGDEAMAKSCFEIAHTGNRRYLDAKWNFENADGLRLTRSPIKLKETGVES